MAERLRLLVRWEVLLLVLLGLRCRAPELTTGGASLQHKRCVVVELPGREEADGAVGERFRVFDLIEIARRVVVD